MPNQSRNSLSGASSSYLRSAMHQPIKWREWGEEAFLVAKLENKPILLDIGAVWCHWCHVMDRESYENPEIAQIVNERFVAIKVDRDERPDVDSRYQVAVQAISGQGGWPLTAFLTPDGKPFYGGTYFPPADHHGRPSFRRVLLAISDAYREKATDVLEQAQLVEGTLAHAEAVPKGEAFRASVVRQIVDAGLKMFDEHHGGFGSAPKFPHPAMLGLLIDQYLRSGEDRLREVFDLTLKKMARGGVYDQLGGGFHRYSVDERWVVPHFEKLSYDNSELLKNYVHAYQATGDRFFGALARDIIGWMDGWLTDQHHGGFYASQDADYSMDDDGDYFTWTLDEAKAVLSEEEARVISLYYDIHEIGEMHHNPAKNVLYEREPVEEIQARLELPRERIDEILGSAKKKMYAARLSRPTPLVDQTIYVSWNSLAVSAYLQAATVLSLDRARRFALRSLDRALSEGWRQGSGLEHVLAYAGGVSPAPKPSGFLDDYAFTAIACLDAYETTADLSYFLIARQIADEMIQRFYDDAGGGFFDTDRASGKLGVLDSPRKPFQDSPTPAGNPMAAIALLRLYGYVDEESYRQKALKTLEILTGAAGQYGLFAATYGIAAVFASHQPVQIVILGEDETASELHRQAIGSSLFGRSVVRLKFSQAVAPNLPPALAKTIPELPAVKSRQTVAVVCSGVSCKPPVHTTGDLKQLLEEEASAA